jgi:hypothetical protein
MMQIRNRKFIASRPAGATVYGARDIATRSLSSAIDLIGGMFSLVHMSEQN